MKILEILKEKAVESAWITDLTYNRPNKTLTMRLSNRRTFSIPNITRAMFEKWFKAPSKGHFFHQHIKDSYNVRRIK